MRIPWHVAEVLDDLNFSPIERKTGVHFGPDVTFANWTDVAALGARLVELGHKLLEQAKEAENPVCVGTGTESCWVNNQREFVIPTIPKDLEERGSWDKDGVFTPRSGTLRLRLSNPGETLAISGLT